MGEFLGTKIVASRFREYKSFKAAKKYVQILNLKNVKEWQKYTRNKNFPKDIPKSPNISYKKNFKTWSDFLGNKSISTWKLKFLSYKKAKKNIHKFKLRNEKEWRLFTKNKAFKKLHIPVAVDRNYKNKGWKGWPDFLGKKK